jgi:DNA-binding GntR family transcriptional regulator
MGYADIHNRECGRTLPPESIMATRREVGTGLANGSNREANSSSTGLLKERAYEELKRRILNNDYPPGSFLAERQLAEQFGMSKTPVKAALERLELEGFISVSPQQGIVIRALTVHEIADQYEIRAALETFVLRTIAGKLTGDQVARVRANLDAQKRIVGRGEVESAVRLDAEFHTLFAEFLGNQEIVRVMGQLREKMQRVITRVFQINPTRFDSSYLEHLATAEAVFAGNGQRAAELIESHLARGRQLILSRDRG